MSKTYAQKMQEKKQEIIDILSEEEKQKIINDYNALNEEGIMEVLKYRGKQEFKSNTLDKFMPISPEEKDKARAKRALEFSIDDQNIINLVQRLKNKLNNIPAELRKDAAIQMTKENTSPENYLPFYNLITQQGDYGPEGSKSIKYFEPNINAESLGREIGNQETLPVPIPFEVGAVMDDEYKKNLIEGFGGTIGTSIIGSQETFPMRKNMGGLVGYAQGGNMSIQQQTQNVANQGRYGDSMLLHVNPAEVKGLAQAMPITVNPETGQPEAFLPFLAPILGSMAGTALLGAGTAAALSPALAAGIGAGLATYAQTGGSGSKALLSGLTAGFGTSALGNAANPNLASDIGSAQVAQGVADGASQAVTTQASQQAVANAAMPTAGQSIQTAFSGGFDEGAKTLANAAMSPSGMMAGTALGGRGIINSQELFEQQMRQLEIDEEQRKRDMYANNPEIQLYSASGGMTQFNRGGNTDDYGSESFKQVYAPAKQQYAVNPNFMAGFAPETMYFRPDTINAPSSSTRGGSRPTLGADTYTGTKGGYDYEGSYDADGNFVAGTAQGVQFAPQTAIDPYAAYSGSAPQGLVQSAYNPYPVQPMSMSPTDETEDTSDYTDIGGDDYSGNPDFDFSIYNATDSAGNPLTGSPYGAYDRQAVADIRDQYSNYFFDYDDIQDFYRNEMTNIGRQAGGNTDMPNKGLDALAKTEKGRKAIEKMGYQEGGESDFRQDPMTQEVIAFLMGDSDDTNIVDMFVDKYGNETFMALREMVLNPDGTKQTEGLIAGMGNSGMADDLLGSIGNKEKIAVSQDEFIVPADVVSGLGDGSSDAGSKELYAMMDRVRQKRTGTTKQPAMLANAGGLLPA
jgi:hypothetical protein